MTLAEQIDWDAVAGVGTVAAVWVALLACIMQVQDRRRRDEAIIRAAIHPILTARNQIQKLNLDPEQPYFERDIWTFRQTRVLENTQELLAEFHLKELPSPRAIDVFCASKIMVGGLQNILRELDGGRDSAKLISSSLSGAAEELSAHVSALEAEAEKVGPRGLSGLLWPV